MIGENRPRQSPRAESPLGLAWMPFSPDAGAGSFVPSASQGDAIRRVGSWWADAPAGSLAMITGPSGSGVSRTLIEVRRLLDRGRATVCVLDRPEAGRSDAQLLREAIVAFGGEATGRTGLELQASLRETLTHVAAAGPRPLLIIDGGPLGGSQLEVLRAVLGASPVGILIAGQPDLALRVARRPSLNAALGMSASIEPFTNAELSALIHKRLEDAGGRGGVLGDAACDLVIGMAAGSPGAAMTLMREAVRHAITRGGSSIEVDDIAGMTADDSGATDDDALVAIQTRLTLPGFDAVTRRDDREGRR